MLLERDPLLVYGEGEYGVTDLLYAAARSKNSSVFKPLLDFAMSPRCSLKGGGELEEQLGCISAEFKWEMRNRVVHALARGGNLEMLRELLRDGSDVLTFRDAQGYTVLHSASGRGQVEVRTQTFLVFISFIHVNSLTGHCLRMFLGKIDYILIPFEF